MAEFSTNAGFFEDALERQKIGKVTLRTASARNVLGVTKHDDSLSMPASPPKTSSPLIDFKHMFDFKHICNIAMTTHMNMSAAALKLRQITLL